MHILGGVGGQGTPGRGSGLLQTLCGSRGWVRGHFQASPLSPSPGAGDPITVPHHHCEDAAGHSVVTLLEETQGWRCEITCRGPARTWRGGQSRPPLAGASLLPTLAGQRVRPGFLFRAARGESTAPSRGRGVPALLLEKTGAKHTLPPREGDTGICAPEVSPSWTPWGHERLQPPPGPGLRMLPICRVTSCLGVQRQRVPGMWGSQGQKREETQAPMTRLPGPQ